MFCAGYSGKVTKNNYISTIGSFGPEYRVVVDIIVHSVGSGWQNIIHFTSSEVDCCSIGDRNPAIFYHSSGKLRIAGAVGSKTYYFDLMIDLQKWYHIEIVQQKKNEKVRE